MLKKQGFLCLYFFVLLCGVSAEKNEKETTGIVGRSVLEEGRTLVHHTVKRMMVLMPAIFFKLGIAFTMLIIVTLVSINNGFIGFLLLVVGLSSVLARLQGSRTPAALPYFAPMPSFHHHSLYDRMDRVATEKSTNFATVGTVPYQSFNYG